MESLTWVLAGVVMVAASSSACGSSSAALAGGAGGGGRSAASDGGSGVTVGGAAGVDTDATTADAAGDAASTVDGGTGDAAQAYTPSMLAACTADAAPTGGSDDAGSNDGGSLVGGTPVIEPGDPGTVDVTFSIRADRGFHAISPLIYGTNDRANFVANNLTLLRAGGNRWTAYNWENNASNAGKDNRYQNDNFLSPSATPGAAVLTYLTTASQIGGTPLITVPLVEYVAFDEGADGDVRVTPDYLNVRFRQNMPLKGAALAANPDAQDAYVYQDEFVSWVKGAAAGAKVSFSLDNEPDLWSSTHPEVYPVAVTYNELIGRNVDFASAIKGVWPDATVFGFVSYGWQGYETLQNATDGPGNGEFVAYYLDKMKQAQCVYGKRLIDYLDLHWYPEATGGGTRITTAQSPAAVGDARVQAPRSLWDSTYVETSWIATALGNAPIQLIPRMRAKIDAGYPGTKLSFSEWSYGGGADISGAVATADVLGIFGREGVDAAAFWPSGRDTFTYAAFRAYRNFDGAGGKFGDISIEATSSDNAAASVYASVDSTQPNRVVIVAINKQTTAATAGIRVAHPASFTAASVYVLTSAAANLVAAAPLAPVSINSFSYAMPARSASVLVLAP